MSVCVLGSINLDNVCRVAHIPVAGETILASGLQRFAGGKGANQAVAASAWGATARLIGATGTDEAAAFLRKHLQGAGVDVSAVAALAETPSGQAHICVADSGENMIVVIGGANRGVSAEHVAAADLTGVSVVLSQLETPITAVSALFERASALGALRILNAAPATVEGLELFALADVIVVNQSELALYTGDASPVSAAASAPLARQLIRRADQAVIVTLGAGGAMAVTAGGRTVVDGHTAAVVDTTGAGDCFCGVLGAVLSQGLDLQEALRWANGAAAVSTERPGAFAPASLRADTYARLGKS